MPSINAMKWFNQDLLKPGKTRSIYYSQNPAAYNKLESLVKKAPAMSYVYVYASSQKVLYRAIKDNDGAYEYSQANDVPSAGIKDIVSEDGGSVTILGDSVNPQPDLIQKYPGAYRDTKTLGRKGYHDGSVNRPPKGSMHLGAGTSTERWYDSKNHTLYARSADDGKYYKQNNVTAGGDPYVKPAKKPAATADSSPSTPVATTTSSTAPKTPKAKKKKPKPAAADANKPKTPAGSTTGESSKSKDKPAKVSANPNPTLTIYDDPAVEAAKRIVIADANRDGTVSAEEQKAFTKLSHNQYLNKKEAREAFKRGPGTTAQQNMEYEIAINRGGGVATHLEGGKYFRIADTDNSGSLTANEITAYNRLDTNKDGKIDNNRSPKSPN